MTDLVQKIRESLAKISEWPWKIEQETCNCLDIHSEGKLVCQVIDNDGDEITDQMAADAEMIIRAAPWLSEAADEIERLRGRLESDQLIMTGINEDLIDARATIATLREVLGKRTKCATCSQGKYLPTQESNGHWIHLYEDGTFIGPCFDPAVAPALPTAQEDE